MTYLAEMSLAERKALSKEELRICIDREEREACFACNREFEPISDERLEEIYNDLQAEKDDPDEDKRGYLRALFRDIMDRADEKSCQ